MSVLLDDGVIRASVAFEDFYHVEGKLLPGPIHTLTLIFILNAGKPRPVSYIHTCRRSLLRCCYVYNVILFSATPSSSLDFTPRYRRDKGAGDESVSVLARLAGGAAQARKLGCTDQSVEDDFSYYCDSLNDSLDMH